ncbi:hypothetical protein SLA2020_245270 [Shorea laevis]
MSIMVVGLFSQLGLQTMPSLAQLLIVLSVLGSTSNLDRRREFIVTRLMLPVVFGFLRPSVIDTNTVLKAKLASLEPLHVNTFALLNYSMSHLNLDRG